MKRTTGLSLLILIFLSMCLITFSLLSLSGATADEKLSLKAAEHTSQYQAANSEAQKILSRIDQALAELFTDTDHSDNALSPDTRFYLAVPEVQKYISDIQLNISVNNSDLTDTAPGGTISYTVPVNEDQSLQVVLQIQYPYSDDDTLYQIDSWKVINTREWKADTSQNVLRLNDIDELTEQNNE